MVLLLGSTLVEERGGEAFVVHVVVMLGYLGSMYKCGEAFVVHAALLVDTLVEERGGEAFVVHVVVMLASTQVEESVGSACGVAGRHTR